jgi:hypothetical protein
MEMVLIGGLISASLTIIGLLFKEFNRKINCKVNRELCDERSGAIASQLERQEQILLRNEQRLIRIESKIAYLHGEMKNELDHD